LTISEMNLPAASEPAPPAPTFDSLSLSPEVRRAIDEIGWVNPTPVQLAAWEPAQRSRDLIVQARTGTGKTAAFALPLVDKRIRPEPVVQALILAPTRELSLQSARELERLGKYREIRTTAVYGGASMEKQVRELEEGAQVVSGTPGRVLDHLKRGTLKVDELRTLILDEADEMLSMGFAKELNAIVEFLPKTRQTWLFSATIDEQVLRMASRVQKDPEHITLSSDQVGAQTLKHFVYLVSGVGKARDLVRVIEVENPESAIVFCNTKIATEEVAKELQAAGYDADWLNGDLPQSEREAVLARTRKSELRFLVATDVAARGIDISHLTHVINYDFPDANEQYVHRTGRTGRAGRTGTAISLIAPTDLGQLYYLRLQYKIFPVERSLPSAGELKTRAELDRIEMLIQAFGASNLLGQGAKEADRAIARRILAHDDGERIVAGLVRAFFGAQPDAESDEQAAAARRSKPPRPAPEPGAEAERKAEPRGRDERRRDEERGERRRRREERVERAEAEAPAEPAAASAKEAPSDGPSPPVEARASAEPEGPGGEGEERPRRRRRRDRDAEARPPEAAPSIEAPREREPRAFGPDDAYTNLFLNVGKRDGVKVVDLLRLFESQAGLGKEQLGRIRIRDRHSFVAVPKDATERAIAQLTGFEHAGRALAVEVARADQQVEAPAQEESGPA